MNIKHRLMQTLAILVALYSFFQAEYDIETDSAIMRFIAYCLLYGFSIVVGILIPFSEVKGMHLHQYL